MLPRYREPEHGCCSSPIYDLFGITTGQTRQVGRDTLKDPFQSFGIRDGGSLHKYFRIYVEPSDRPLAIIIIKRFYKRKLVLLDNEYNLNPNFVKVLIRGFDQKSDTKYRQFKCVKT